MECSEQKKIDQSNIKSVMNAWATAFCDKSPEKLLSLYADDAVMWGTLSGVRRDNPVTIRDYFEHVFSFTGRKVSFHNPLIRIYGDTSVNTGTYTFTWKKGGQIISIAARYSLTYVRSNRDWLIVDHHSSLMPEI